MQVEEGKFKNVTLCFTGIITWFQAFKYQVH